jgi:hypothetical protein
MYEPIPSSSDDTNITWPRKERSWGESLAMAFEELGNIPSRQINKATLHRHVLVFKNDVIICYNQTSENIVLTSGSKERLYICKYWNIEEYVNKLKREQVPESILSQIQQVCVWE